MSVVFSPDRSHVLTVVLDRTVQLWDIQGHKLATVQGHGGEITSAEFSPDGSRFLTVSNDKTVRLWNLQGNLLATLQGHTGPIWIAKFSPDGLRILTASADGTARQYLVSTRDLLTVAACRVGRGLTHVEIARFQIPTPLYFDFAHRRCPPNSAVCFYTSGSSC
jgi:WD40 repeat protein